MDRQLDAMDREEATQRTKRAAALARLEKSTAKAARLDQARTLLQRLHARLDNEPMTEALRRELVEVLVVEVRVDIMEVGLTRKGTAKRRPHPVVCYAFDDPADRVQDNSMTPCRCRP
jgi:hypothetical protein